MILECNNSCEGIMVWRTTARRLTFKRVISMGWWPLRGKSRSGRSTVAEMRLGLKLVSQQVLDFLVFQPPVLFWALVTQNTAWFLPTWRFCSSGENKANNKMSDSNLNTVWEINIRPCHSGHYRVFSQGSSLQEGERTWNLNNKQKVAMEISGWEKCLLEWAWQIRMIEKKPGWLVLCGWEGWAVRLGRRGRQRPDHIRQVTELKCYIWCDKKLWSHLC